MGNAVAAVRDAADPVVGGHDEDGIADVADLVLARLA
jgi:hydroxymethylpyrimidine pyrophosphatase-like HAD family hydrolase